MNKRRVWQYGILAALAGATIIALALVWHARPVKPGDAYYPKASETPRPSASVATSPTGQPAPTQSPIPTSTQPQSNSAGTITIATPTQGSAVRSGTTVSGKTTMTSSTLYFRLKGNKSGQLAAGSVTVANSAYSFPLAFTNQVADGKDEGVLEIYWLSSAGAEVNNVSVMVNIEG